MVLQYISPPPMPAQNSIAIQLALPYSGSGVRPRTRVPWRPRASQVRNARVNRVAHW